MEAGNQKKQERSERRTAEWLREEAVARGLRIGRKVRIETMRIDNDGSHKQLIRRGRVAGLYPYIFVCEMNGIAECFRYNQLIGNEIGERVMLDG